MKNACMLLIAALSLGSVSYADYRGEAVAGMQSNEVYWYDHDEYFFGASIFTRGIAHDGSAPNDELAFYNRVGMVSFGYAEADGDMNALFGGLEIDSASLDSDFLYADYIYRRAGSPHGFRIRLSEKEFDFNLKGVSIRIEGFDSIELPDISEEFDLDRIGFSYVYYLADGFTIGWDVERSEASESELGQLLFSGENSWEYGLTTRRLLSLKNSQWLSLEAKAAYEKEMGDEDVKLDLMGTYYFSQQTGIGAGVNTWNDLDIQLWTIEASHYFTDRFVMDAFYSNGDDIESFGIFARVRF